MAIPISDCQVRDPRIRRTRQLLQGALRKLLQEKSLDEICVHQIAEAATINRATFYDHYADKFALLEAMVAGGFHQLLHDRQIAFDGSGEALKSIIACTCDYLASAHAGSACKLQTAFQPLMDAALVSAIRRVLLAGLRTRSKSSLSHEAIASAVSWALYGTVKEWFTTANRPPAEKIVQSVANLVFPLLEESGLLPDTYKAKRGLPKASSRRRQISGH
jgi:AcrR family transcriptional regulator